MLTTKDNHRITAGDWIYDTTGVYEVKQITTDKVIVDEVIWDDDNSEYYNYGDRLIFSHKEIAHMLYA